MSNPLFPSVPEHLIPDFAPEPAPGTVWVRNRATGMVWEVEGEHASRLLTPVFGEPEYERVPDPTAQETGGEEGPRFGAERHPLSFFEGMTEAEMLGVKGVGPKAVEQIVAALSQRQEEV